jgi:toxin-antitoxin system PIN domain toxin
VTVYLLDVNVLIALIDVDHVHHDPANKWFAQNGCKAWATCPHTENSVLRIAGNPRYPGSPGTPATVARTFAELCSLPGHVLWPDDISILDESIFDLSRLLSSAQVTDTYLLALARANKGQLATFDRRLVTDAVRDGVRSLHRIGID